MSTITNLKLLVRGSLPPDNVFELRAERYPTSEEWDVIFETLMISRRQSDRKRDAAIGGLHPETALATSPQTPLEAKRKEGANSADAE